MSNPLAEYLAAIAAARRLGNDTEHTHRPALKALLDALDARIVATNEPRRVACGAPDFVITRRSDQLAIGYVEAKDIGVSLGEAERSDQLKRYRLALPNLLLTDYLEFRWFVDGEKRATFQLADNADVRLLREFLGREPIRIGGAEELAQRLARLAHLIRDVIAASLREGHASELLTGWREVFAQTLLPEIGVQPEKEREKKAVADFADMFAQTLAYGLFSARIMGNSARKFTRAEAEKLIPKTNPFLRDFFHLITGPQLDAEPFAGFVDDLVALLDHADLARVLEDFGRAGRRDPVVHFYETFLSAYDPKLRELRGVYYTPEPVVGYIVRSIDAILKTQFGLEDGLADKGKMKIPAAENEAAEEAHRVLILDPAAGTGTFLYTVIEHIRAEFETRNRAGLWPGYVREHLIPRLFGFELLMAPYAIAHFKLALELDARHLGPLFQDVWRYEFGPKERLNIFLTNTLEDLEHVAQQLGPLAIVSREANEATAIKKHRPVLVVIGNPPYSGHSANDGAWINGLVDDYYLVDGVHLRAQGERNTKWLRDDYVKFIRWAQWRIESTGQGVVGFITNHRYLRNPTFRGMRQQLMRAFNEIHILDLHGSSQPRETPPEGQANDNVFDIKKGVAIAFFVKHPARAAAKKKKSLARVFHADLWGGRREKYAWLEVNERATTQWQELDPIAPNYLFSRPLGGLGGASKDEYDEAVPLTEIFPFRRMGPNSHRDHFAVAFDGSTLRQRVRDLANPDLSDSELARRYELKESAEWKLAEVRDRLFVGFTPTRCLYRPFDYRYMMAADWAFDRLRPDLLHHLEHENLALLALKQADEGFAVFIADGCVGQHKLASRYDGTYVIPLYLYENGHLPEESLLIREEPLRRRANLSATFVEQFAARLNLRFIADGRGDARNTFGPEDVLHYVYALFHSWAYRKRFAEFLALGFPRVPLTGNQELFRLLCLRGSELVATHLLRREFAQTPAFPFAGDNQVTDPKYYPPPPKPQGFAMRGARRRSYLENRHPGRVYLNAKQYFEGVSNEVWEYQIGGYQVAEKWLKDRKGRVLTHDELDHYARTLAALADTGRLMSGIDTIIDAHGGWPLR